MHTTSHTKLFTILTIDPHMTPGFGVRTLYDMHSLFVDTEAPQDPLQDLPWHTIDGFRKVVEGKVKLFFSGEELFLQLANNVAKQSFIGLLVAFHVE